MTNNIPSTHLFTEQDLHLYEIQNIYTACALWLENKMENQIATYDLIVRDLPKNRNFLLFGGLEEIIEGIRKWKYTKEDVAYLKKAGLATDKLAKYLSKFKFTGDLYSLPEGTAFFPGEPVVRITAPICEGNLFTMFLMNVLSSNTIFLSKIARLRIAAGDKMLVTGGGMRTHGFEAAMKGSRAGYIAGAVAGFPGFFRKYNLEPAKVSINAYHAVIKSFPSEKEAFRAAAALYPNNARPMVDTYDFKKGIGNLIVVAKELKKRGQHFAAITIDSGDLGERAWYAKRAFCRAGFPEIKITLASNLDEWKIQELMSKKIPVDSFLAQTEVACVSDDPKLEVVFKLAELRYGKMVRPVAKLAKGKVSYPGRKQVFRKYNHGEFDYDIIGLENEGLGESLLKKMINQGKIVYRLPSLDEIKDYTKKQIGQLPQRLRSIDKQYGYKVKVSAGLEKLMSQVKKQELK